VEARAQGVAGVETAKRLVRAVRGGSRGVVTKVSIALNVLFFNDLDVYSFDSSRNISAFTRTKMWCLLQLDQAGFIKQNTAWGKS